MPKIQQLSDEMVYETWGEIAKRWTSLNFGNYSISHLKHLWLRCKFRLKHRLNGKGRMRMTEEELIRFKRLIQNLVKE